MGQINVEVEKQDYDVCGKWTREVLRYSLKQSERLSSSYIRHTGEGTNKRASPDYWGMKDGWNEEKGPELSHNFLHTCPQKVFFNLFPCAVTVWEFWGDGAIARPTGAVGLFRFLRIEDCCYL